MLFGDGPLHKNLRQLIAPGNPGQIPHGRVSQGCSAFRAELRFGVISSYTEGLPIILLEMGRRWGAVRFHLGWRNS